MIDDPVASGHLGRNRFTRRSPPWERVRRRLLRARIVEFAAWVIAATLSCAPSLAVVWQYGLSELFRARFYEAYGGNLLVGVFLLVFPTVFVFIFGSTPIIATVATLRRVIAVRSRGKVPAVRVVIGGHESTDRAVDRAVDYLSELAARSRSIAESHLRRSNVHLLSGVLIGMSGLAFFFVVSRNEQEVSYSSGQSLAAPTAASSATDNSRPNGSSPAIAIPAASVMGSDHSVIWQALLLNLAQSLPRVAILVFIELMAGFFLRQYRTALEEYRYFETIQRQRESIVAAYLLNQLRSETGSVDVLTSKLFDSTPVGILKNGESTTILEAQKQSENEFRLAIDQLFSLVGQIKKQVSP